MEPFVAMLTDDERSALRQHSVERRFSKGEVVFHEGDPGDSIHLVERGLFVATSSSTRGHVLAVNVFRAGTVFGEFSLFSVDALRSATITAVHPGRTRMVRRAAFNELRSKYPSLNDLLLQMLVERNRKLTQQVVELLFTPTHRRVHRQLLHLDELGIACDAEGWIVLSQDDLATLTATTRATVNRALRDAERHGCLELRRGRSRIIDRVALARLAS